MSNPKAKVHEALLSAFPSRDRLALMLGLRFGVNYDTLTPESFVDVEYWNVVVQMEAQGRLLDLLRAAFETVPRNEKLEQLAMQLGLTSLGAQAAGAASPAVIALERLVRQRGTLKDLPTFLAQLSALEGQTCRVEWPGSKAQGTGFLVGPDLVMTNHHVIDGLSANGPADAHCRFDYLTDATGVEVRAGVRVPFAAAWHVHSRPHDPADVSLDDADEPAADTLDFAVVRLAQPVGEAPRHGEAGPGNPPRGWVAIDPARDLAKDEDILILQHPSGAPLKLGQGRVTEVRANGLRLRHDVTTEGGSSGSPVLNASLELAALHHAGDPNWQRPATYNEAIPMSRIVAYLSGKVDPFWEVKP